MQNINAVYQIEFAAACALAVPCRINVECSPLERQIAILRRQFTLTAPPKKGVGLRDEVAFNARQKSAFIKPAQQNLTGASGSGADFQNPELGSGTQALGCKDSTNPIIHCVSYVLILKIIQPQRYCLWFEQALFSILLAACDR